MLDSGITSSIRWPEVESRYSGLITATWSKEIMSIIFTKLEPFINVRLINEGRN